MTASMYSPLWRHTILLAVTFRSAWLAPDSCFDRTGKNYSLNATFEGRAFFDHWDFGETDFTGGAVRYVDRDTAHIGRTSRRPLTATPSFGQAA